MGPLSKRKGILSFGSRGRTKSEGHFENGVRFGEKNKIITRLPGEGNAQSAIEGELTTTCSLWKRFSPYNTHCILRRERFSYVADQRRYTCTWRRSSRLLLQDLPWAARAHRFEKVSQLFFILFWFLIFGL